MKTLIVYFSRTGENYIDGEIETITKGFTSIVAEKIAKYTGAELFPLVPEVAYPTNYEACVRRAREEDQNNTLVPFKNPKDNIDDYDVIYLGFPNWYRSYPRIVASFLSRYSFVGKTIKPFCTNEEGLLGVGEIELKSTVKGALIKPGFACKGIDAENCDEKLKAWIEK